MSTGPNRVPLYWQRRNREAMQAGLTEVSHPIVNDPAAVASTEEEVVSASAEGPVSAAQGQASAEGGAAAGDEPIVVDDSYQSSACIDLTDDEATVIDLTVVPTNANNPQLTHEAQALRSAVQRMSSRKIPRNAALPVDSDEDVEVIATSQSTHRQVEGSPGSGISPAVVNAESKNSPAEALSSQSSAILCTVCLDDANQIRNDGRQLSSTNCGHVFCDPCIRNAAKTTKACPVCRRKLTAKSIHPLFI